MKGKKKGKEYMEGGDQDEEEREAILFTVMGDDDDSFDDPGDQKGIELMTIKEDKEEDKEEGKEESTKESKNDDEVYQDSPSKSTKEPKTDDKPEPQIPNEQWFLDRCKDVADNSQLLFQILDFLNELVDEHGKPKTVKQLQTLFNRLPGDCLPENPQLRKEIITQQQYINYLLQGFLWRQVFFKNNTLPWFEQTTMTYM